MQQAAQSRGSQLLAQTAQKVPGPLLVLTAACLISFSPVLVHLARDVGPNAAGFWRNLLGGLILAGAAASLGQSLWRGWGNLGLCALTGFWFALDLSFWHRSVHMVGPGISTILVGFQVFVMAAAGVLYYQERITWRLLVSIPLALCGLYLLVGLPWFEAGRDYQWGVICGLIAAVALGFYMLSLKHLQSRPGNQSHLANMALVSLSAAFFLGAEGARMGEALWLQGSTSWLAMLGYGFFCQALAMLCQSFGLPRTQASSAGLIMLSQPALSFGWDITLFARPTTWFEVLGALLALGAIYLGSSRVNKNEALRTRG